MLLVFLVCGTWLHFEEYAAAHVVQTAITALGRPAFKGDFAVQIKSQITGTPVTGKTLSIYTDTKFRFETNYTRSTRQSGDIVVISDGPESIYLVKGREGISTPTPRDIADHRRSPAFGESDILSRFTNSQRYTLSLQPNERHDDKELIVIRVTTKSTDELDADLYFDPETCFLQKIDGYVFNSNSSVMHVIELRSEYKRFRGQYFATKIKRKIGSYCSETTIEEVDFLPMKYAQTFFVKP